MTIDLARRRWEQDGAKRPIATAMDFADGWLVLGAGTRLAKLERGEMSPRGRARLVALLAAAHRRPIEASPLRYVERALVAKCHGDVALAYMHIALSRLGKLAHPQDDARRLFMVDALMEEGVEPSAILKGLGFDPADRTLATNKYSPDQPRVPAGNGRPSGQWTGGDWIAATGASSAARPADVQVADASTTRGQEVMSDTSPTSIAYPGDFHDQVLQEELNWYRSTGAQCVSEVRLQINGVTARLDILCKAVSGLLLGVEIKTGDDPEFTLQQQIVYPHTLTGGLVSTPDAKATALGLLPGQPLPPFPIFFLMAPGPGLPYHVFGPKPYQ
jgi:hypothetical protein